MAASNGASHSAVSAMSCRLPMAMTQQLWIIRKLAAPISIWSLAMAMIDAADAAMPMTLTVTDWGRSEEHTSELKSLMRISYAVFCLKKKTKNHKTEQERETHKQH